MGALALTRTQLERERGALLRLREQTRLLADAANQDPLSWVRWTPKQDEWLRVDPGSGGVKLLRGGNQAIGKTWVGMAEVHYRCTGTHPHYPTRIPPIECWVVCTSWSQSVAIQKKFWALAPKHLLTPATRNRYSARRGWGKDNPTVEYTNGSIVRFRTTNQGAEALAGDSIDYAAIDEPTDEEIYREVHKRVMRAGGAVGITLTPVNRDCTWLRKLVEKKVVLEVHAKLHAPDLIPIGRDRPLTLLDGTPMDQAWVDEMRRTTPARWAPVILDGEWDTVPEGVWYTCFDRKKHVQGAKFNPARGPIFFCLGFDYASGDRDYGHVAELVAVQEQRDEKGRKRHAVLALDEVALGGTDSNAKFAQEVVRMLERNRLRWDQLHFVHGDNPVTSRWAEKSNLNTMRAIAVELGIAYDALNPRILNAKDDIKSAGSFDNSNQWVYERIANGDTRISPRCEKLAKGLETWDYTKTHPLKDPIDAFRYALKPFIFPKDRASNVEIYVG